MDEQKREFEDYKMSLSKRDVKNKGKSKKSKIEKAGDKKKNPNKKPSKFMTKWKGLEKWKRVTIIVVAIILALALIAFGVFYGIYNGYRTNVDEGNLGISSDIEDKYGKSDIFNVAVFGLDTRDEDSFSGRSDSIIIVSVDRANNTVKLTSILRDSYVAIDGYADQKITHAYAFGGAELAIKTLNQNFNMNITDYATINFYKLANAIDVMGGVDLNITESEMKQINVIGNSEGKTIAKVTDYGEVHLNGDQAAVYVRLRENDSDIMRSQRQKNVINALIVQAKKVSPTKYAEVVKTMMSLCETSLSASEVLSFAPMITQQINIQTLTVPGDEDNAVGGIYNGAWVWRYDLNAAADRIHMFIYGEVPSTPVTTMKSSKTTTTKKSSSTTSSNKGNSNKPASTSPAPSTNPRDEIVETTTKPIEITSTTKSSETTTSASAED